MEKESSSPSNNGNINKTVGTTNAVMDTSTENGQHLKDAIS